MVATSSSTKQTFFDNWAGQYDLMINRVFMGSVHRRFWEMAKVPFGAQVLDVGCGTGQALIQLGRHRPDIGSVGLDLSWQMISRAHQVHSLPKRSAFKQGDAMSLPFEDRSFDQVVCMLSFLHFADPLKVCEEIRRVLKPGGWFYWADIAGSEPLEAVSNWTFQALGAGDVQLFSYREREMLMGFAGLKPKGHQYLLGSILLSGACR